MRLKFKKPLVDLLSKCKKNCFKLQKDDNENTLHYERNTFKRSTPSDKVWINDNNI